MSNVYVPRGINTVSSCSICNGAGQVYSESSITTPSKDPNRQIRMMDSKPCICKMNELVERKHAFMHPNAVPPQMDRAKIRKAVEKWRPLELSYRFMGPLNMFLPLVKKILVYYSFTPRVFHISNGIEVVQEYYVAQAEGVERKVQDLIYNRDLVILRFDTSVENKALKQVVLDLVAGRAHLNRPTWIWTRAGIESTSEFSPDLTEHIKDWPVVDLGAIALKAKKARESKSMSDASTFKSEDK